MFMDVFHSKLVKSQNTIRDLFRDNFASLVQRLRTIFTSEAAPVSQPVDDTGREPIIELHESISECEAAGKARLYRLVGGGLASS